MIGKMAQVAVECAREPRRESVWWEAGNRYVCNNDPQYKEAIAHQTPEVVAAHPPINPIFKLVFLTVAVGTVLSFGSCAILAVLSGEPEMQTRLFHTLLDLGKVGAGAIIGLLGGQVMQTSKKR